MPVLAVFRMAGADTLNIACPGSGGGAGIEGVGLLVLMLTSELVNNEYLKGG